MNILFIMADSLVPHLTGPYGDPMAHTPNLDALAATGTVFTNAYCNSPLCAPSRASMLTGRYVSDIGVFDNANEFSSEWPTIPYALRGAGYETTLIGKMHLVGHDQLHGFDNRLAWESDYTTEFNIENVYRLAWSWEQPARSNPAGDDWMGPSYVYSDKWKHYPRHYDDDESIHKAAVEYLSSQRPDSQPFFCCVSYHAPHNPFWIPDQFKAPFRGRDLPLPKLAKGLNTCHGPMDEWLNAFHYVPEVQEAMMKHENLRWLYETYYGMVNDLDRRVGMLLEILRTKGLDKDTAVVFASDHGDMLGTRGMLQKRYLYEWSTRVALICSLPCSSPRNARVPQLVSLVDLFPTLAEMAGASVPCDLPGCSLMPAITLGNSPGERPVYCEYHGEGVLAPCFSIRSGCFKYIYVHGHEERLYNVEDDPLELTNLVSQSTYAATAARLRNQLMAEFDPDTVFRSALTSQRNRTYLLNTLSGKNAANESGSVVSS